MTNSVSAEYHMKELLISSKDLKHRRDHGMEYFEGSLYNILILVAATVPLNGKIGNINRILIAFWIFLILAKNSPNE